MNLVLDWLAKSDNLSVLADVVTVIGLPLATIGLFAVARQMRNDRLAVSAGAISEMRASMFGRIDRIQSAGLTEDTSRWSDEVSELFNDMEMACAIYLDGQMSGRTGALAKNMICDFLDIINANEDIRAELERSIHRPHTFENIKEFRTKVKRDV